MVSGSRGEGVEERENRRHCRERRQREGHLKRLPEVENGFNAAGERRENRNDMVDFA